MPSNRHTSEDDGFASRWLGHNFYAFFCLQYRSPMPQFPNSMSPKTNIIAKALSVALKEHSPTRPRRLPARQSHPAARSCPTLTRGSSLLQIYSTHALGGIFPTPSLSRVIPASTRRFRFLAWNDPPRNPRWPGLILRLLYSTNHCLFPFAVRRVGGGFVMGGICDGGCTVRAVREMPRPCVEDVAQAQGNLPLSKSRLTKVRHRRTSIC